MRDFPEEVQDEIGHALQVAHWNGVPHGVKPLKGFGGIAVMEIVERHDANVYRAVYTARFADAVYVLHCFQKKSKSGIATTQQDIELIAARLRDAREQYDERFGR